MKIAVAKYAIDAPQRFDDFAERQRRWLHEAAAAGARIAVLPEYLSLSLGATFEPAIRGDLHASLAGIQRYRSAWLDLYAGLSRDSGMRIVAGTFLLDTGNGRYRNRADLFSPEGGHVWQSTLR